MSALAWITALTAVAAGELASDIGRSNCVDSASRVLELREVLGK